MSTTINLKSPEELYKKAPDLAIIADRLENSVLKTKEENNHATVQSRKNRDTPGAARQSKIKYPEHFRFTKIFKDGQWNKLPTELKSGKSAFEQELTTIVSTRNPQVLEIEIYSGKATRNTSHPEKYTIYLSEEAKAEVKQTVELGNVQETNAVKNLEEKFIQLSKSNGNNESTELLKSDFARQLNNFKHESELKELKRDHERELEKKDAIIKDLQAEVEELEEQLEDADGELSGAADLILAKQKPPAIQELLTGIGAGILKQFAIENPRYLSAVTNKSPEEIKEMLVADADDFAKANEQPKIAENAGASFSEASPIDEYEGLEADQVKLLKGLHEFAKGLSIEDLQTFYNICAFVCNKEAQLDHGKANQLIEFIKSNL